MKAAVKSRLTFPGNTGCSPLWLGGAVLLLLIFFRITRELIEGDVDATDKAILSAVRAFRTPWLTSAAVDITALGSITVVVLLCAIGFLVLLALRDRLGALQLLLASSGAGALTSATKNFIERIRPDEVPPLIVVSGFSYPSGHSVAAAALYLTIAIIASRSLTQPRARAVIFLTVTAVLILIGASRVYLGVHYATDVISGLSLGAAWALLLDGFFSRLGYADTSHQEPSPYSRKTFRATTEHQMTR